MNIKLNSFHGYKLVFDCDEITFKRMYGYRGSIVFVGDKKFYVRESPDKIKLMMFEKRAYEQMNLKSRQ